MSETVPIRQHARMFDLYDADGCLVGKASPGRKVMLHDGFYVPERACRNIDSSYDRGFECSSCGYEAETYGDSLCSPDDFEFCPMCGAKVIEEGI